jgi:signal transduction histidine kinase
MICTALCTNAQELRFYNGEKLTIEKCLEIAKQRQNQGDLKEATRFLNQAAMFEWEAKNYSQAITHFQQSIQLNEKINNQAGITQINNNLGMIYADKQDYEKSLLNFQKALAGRRQENDKDNTVSALINISVVLNKLKRYSESSNYLEEALTLSREMNDLDRMKSCYGMLSETYEKAGNLERSLYYFEFYRSFHEKSHRDREKDLKNQAEKSDLLAKLNEEKKKNAEFALEFTTKELELKKDELLISDAKIEELMNTLSKKDIVIKYLNANAENLKHQNELREVHLKINQLSAQELKILNELKLEREKSNRNIWLASSAFLFLVLTIVGVRYMDKRKLNQNLAKKNQEISAQRSLILAQKNDLVQYNETLENQVKSRTDELQQANQNLLQYNAQLEQFAFMVAHNLRAPVARLFGLGKIIDLDDVQNPNNRLILEKMQVSTEHLDHIIHDLNRILEIKKGLNAHNEEVDLQESLNVVLTTLQIQIEEAKAEIKTDFTTLQKFNSVKAYFDSILYNLISNAIKYREVNRPLVVEVKTSLIPDSEMFCLEVKDNGLGIDLEKHGTKLFSLYKRFHSHVEGKGLGLHLVKTQIEALGGSIELESKVGQGSMFKVFLKNA